MRKFLIPLLAVLGFGLAIALLLRAPKLDVLPTPAGRSAAAPYAANLAAVGMLESSTENVAIGTPVAGIVASVFVHWGDQVKTGDPLFQIDDRDLRAQLLPLLARVSETKAGLNKARHLLEVATQLGERSAISRQDIIALQLDAGIAEAAYGSAQAMVAQLRIEMDRRTIRAPLPGRILQLKLRPGEFADSAPPRAPLLLLGDDHRLHVRAEIDENLAWRFDAGAAASVFVRGNPDLHAPLQFERVEPYVVPKSAFTGSSTERADTRVLQVIYSFDRNALPVYVGQQVDVFIQAAPVPVDAAARRDAESP